MNLAATISIYAGGPGSGCQGPHCGRPLTVYHGTVLDSAKQIWKNGLRDTPERKFAVNQIPQRLGYVYATTDHAKARKFAEWRAEYEKTRPGERFHNGFFYKNPEGQDDLMWTLANKPEIVKGAFTPAIVTMELPKEVVNKMQADPDSGEVENFEEISAYRAKGVFPARYVAKVEVMDNEQRWHAYKSLDDLEHGREMEAQGTRKVYVVYYGPLEALKAHLALGNGK